MFKILPRYKVRSVGDEVCTDLCMRSLKTFNDFPLLIKVRMEDQVTFASEKTEGQYIHTSSKTYHQVKITLHENK